MKDGSTMVQLYTKLSIRLILFQMYSLHYISAIVCTYTPIPHFEQYPFGFGNLENYLVFSTDYNE